MTEEEKTGGIPAKGDGPKEAPEGAEGKETGGAPGLKDEGKRENGPKTADGAERDPDVVPDAAAPSEIVGFVRQGIRDTFSGVGLFVRIASALLFMALAGLYVSTGFHSVSQNEVGLLERLGRLEGAPLSPGFHLTLPWPFDRVTKIPIKTVRKLSIECFYPPRREAADPLPTSP